MDSHKVWHGGTVDGEKRSKAVSSVGSPIRSFTHPPAKATTQLSLIYSAAAFGTCDPQSTNHKRFYALFECEELS